MTTATRQSVTAELKKLQAARDAAYKKVRAARETLSAWEAEVPALQREYASVDPKSAKAAKLRPEIQAREQSRIHGIGKLREELAREQAPAFELDNQLQAFQQANVQERIAEGSLYEEAEELRREAFELLLKSCRLHEADARRVGEIVANTPGLERQTDIWDYDPRPAEWARLAERALDEELVPPSLTEMAHYKLTQIEQS